MLTDKQEQFCLEYVVDFNATQAAIRAGYSENTASEIGYENLRKPQIAERLSALRSEAATATELTREFVIQGLMDLARSGSTESARVRSYELLGKHLALFTDRLEISQVPDRALVQEWIAALEADVASNAG